MSVSIIIPNYNCSGYLSKCIDSCIAQGKKVTEIIVVDDHSTDDSFKILKAYETKFPSLVQVFTNPKKGACSARNYGFALSNGKYIQFLDSDDFLEEGKIDKQICELEELGAESISFSQTVHYYECAGNFDREVIDALPFEELSKNPVRFLCNLWGGNNFKGYIIANSAWLVPRKVIEKVGSWNENLLRDQDGEFFARIVLASKRIIFTESAKTFYRKDSRSNSITKTVNKEYLMSELEALNLKFSYLKSYKDTKLCRRAFAYQYLRLAVSFYPQHLDLYNEAINRYKSLNTKVPTPKLGGRVVEILKYFLGWKATKKLKFFIKSYSIC